MEADNNRGRDFVSDISFDYIENIAKRIDEEGLITFCEDDANEEAFAKKSKADAEQIDKASRSVADSSEAKFADLSKLKGIKIDKKLLPHIVAENPEHDGETPNNLADIVTKGSAQSMSLLCGEGGSGKTYLLFDCYQTLLDTDGIIPIYVPMSQLSKTGKSPLLHYVFDHYFVKTGWPRDIDGFKQSLINHLETTGVSIALLLDAFNEYTYSTEPASISIVEDEIRWLCGFQKIRVIITSRSSKGFSSAEVYRTTKLENKYVAEYLAKHQSTAGINIWDASNERLLELLRLPIMLTLFTETYSSGNAKDKAGEIQRIEKHSDILELCVSKQLGDLKDNKTASYVFKVLLPHIASKMDSIRIKRQAIGKHAKSAVQQTMSDDYSDLWWEDDYDRSTIEEYGSDERTAYRHFIEDLLLKNGLFLSEAGGTVSWQHELLMNWFMAKYVVLGLTYEREPTLEKIREVAVTIEESSSEADALLPVALYIYEMLDADDEKNPTEEFALILIAIARTYSDWRDSKNAYKFANLALEKVGALVKNGLLRYKAAEMKCRAANTLLSIDATDMEEPFDQEACLDNAKRHLEEAKEWGGLDITSPEDAHQAAVTRATLSGSLGAYNLAKHKLHKEEKYLLEALRNHEEGLELRCEAHKHDIDSPDAALHIGASYHCIATDHYQLGDYDSSILNHRKAIKCREAGKAKDIKLVESYTRAIGTLLKIIETSGGSRELTKEIVDLFSKALNYPDCFRKNGYELKNLIEYHERFAGLILSNNTEIEDSSELAVGEIRNKIERLSDRRL